MRSYDERLLGEATRPIRRNPERVPAHFLGAALASRTAPPDAILALQRTAGNAAVAQLLGDQRGDEERRSPVLGVVGRGAGEPLDPATRQAMEAGLGADFGDVRLHTDDAAAASAESVQAQAYTVGDEVVFQSGLYQPSTSSGQRMLAHELTHVIQQRSGPVDGTPTGAGVSVSHPSDRFEQAAESNAERFMAGEFGAIQSSAPAQLQRSSDDEVWLHSDQALQGVFVQRDGEEELEEEPATS